MTDLTDFLNVVASAEDWAGFGADGREPEEPMKRFTIDVPVGLYRRIKAACDKRAPRVSSVLRDLLEREFHVATIATQRAGDRVHLLARERSRGAAGEGADGRDSARDLSRN